MHRWRRYEVETCKDTAHSSESNQIKKSNSELIPTSLPFHECHIFLKSRWNIILLDNVNGNLRNKFFVKYRIGQSSHPPNFSRYCWMNNIVFAPFGKIGLLDKPAHSFLHPKRYIELHFDESQVGKNRSPSRVDRF